MEVNVRTTGDDGRSSVTSWLVTDSGNEDMVLLTEWWIGTAARDLERGMPKIDEYGAHDLEIMGAVLVLLAYKEKIEILSRAQAAPIGTELACWFYVLGKVARLVSDYMAERPGKADTWHDITFYSMMARRIQEVGTWP